MLAVRGIYTGEQVRCLEPVHVRPNVRVIITFLEDEEATSNADADLEEFLALCGTWEDDRPVEEIVKDIYESRTIGKTEVNL